MSALGFVEALGGLFLVIIVVSLVFSVTTEYGHKKLEEKDWNNHT